jgi:uncharacterized phage-associated protein
MNRPLRTSNQATDRTDRENGGFHLADSAVSLSGRKWDGFDNEKMPHCLPGLCDISATFERLVGRMKANCRSSHLLTFARVILRKDSDRSVTTPWEPMPLRFKMNWQKAVEGIHFLASIHRGITPYYVAKIFFYADKEHMMDWGRPICGDFYVAMENGPVPSNIYNLVKREPFIDDDIIADFDSRIEKQDRAMSVRRDFNQVALSNSDIEYLRRSEQIYGHMSFGRLRELVHRERAWRDAWENRISAAPRVDMESMIDENVDNRDRLIQEIIAKSAYAATG